MRDPIQIAISKAVTNTAKSVDEYLLSFFGSEEHLREFGKNYILEYEDSKFETQSDKNDLTFHISMTTNYRLRLKTKEELANS